MGSLMAARRSALATVARYRVASPAPPRLTAAVAVAAKVRAALQRHSDGAAVFSGKSASGAPLRGHGHAFIFCEAGGDGRLQYVTIYAAMGFDGGARAALGRLEKVWGHGGPDLRLTLAGVGRPADFAGLSRPGLSRPGLARPGLSRPGLSRPGLSRPGLPPDLCPLLAEARVWVPYTPFVPTRHPKVTRAGRRKLDERGLQIGSAEHDLRRLLAERGLAPIDVQPFRQRLLGGRPTPWRAFRTPRRGGGGRRSTAAGFGFRVEFREPVRGPIAVGYGAHFGLGTFTPADAGTAAQ